MAILGNYKTNYDTETTTANNSMGFDPSAIQSCRKKIVLFKYIGEISRSAYKRG